ncbi:double-strand break repair protein MRE11 [Galleria mellonella]|uniref:Double-strand break repair protein n=1 Tax=Galleria mellonella TaxID=7137 RepID=A0A6J1X593_GALME|nr:double-strand break repair protein MRE11 [Galleria mellonella]
MVGIDPGSWSADDTMRILIASDIHLGYLENDAVRGEDSFIAFEEVLSLAVQYDADLILLGGDLFDHAKPSPACMFKCTQLIRKYCLGDKPISVELLSDQFVNFSRVVNYEDPNLNVSYPILSIHGNHDDPVGQSSISSLDILSITGLVNYFGKWSDYTHVRITPVLMQKGSTKLALYGLSHLKDQRLSRLFAEKKVEIERPDDGNDWFNLLTLHQNRADRGPSNYIREDVLPSFLDLVVWGHEHDCQLYEMKENKTENERFFVVQPGSTVATSLASGEALPKHCALLQIHNSDYILTPIPLKTVRPFIFKTIVLSEEDLGSKQVNENEKVQEFLKSKINEAISEAEKLRSGDPKQPTLPLVRLSVFYEREEQDFNRVRFGQNFNGLVANPNDILIMKKEKKIRERKEQINNEDNHISGVAAEAVDVESLLRTYFESLPPERNLQVLSVRAVTDAVREFTLKHDDDVFRRVFEAHKRRCVAALLESTAEKVDEVEERLRICKQELDAADDDQLRTLIDTTAALKVNNTPTMKRAVVVLSSDDEAKVEEAMARGRGRGARGARGRGRGRGRSRARADPDPPPPEPAPERRTTPRRSAAQKSATWLQSLATTRRRRESSDIEDSD